MKFQEALTNLIQGIKVTRPELNGSHIVVESFPEKTGKNFFIIDPNTQDRKVWEITNEDYTAENWVCL